MLYNSVVSFIFYFPKSAFYHSVLWIKLMRSAIRVTYVKSPHNKVENCSHMRKNQIRFSTSSMLTRGVWDFGALIFLVILSLKIKKSKWSEFLIFFILRDRVLCYAFVTSFRKVRSRWWQFQSPSICLESKLLVEDTLGKAT